jgi:hypothetical protein
MIECIVLPALVFCSPVPGPTENGTAPSVLSASTATSTETEGADTPARPPKKEWLGLTELKREFTDKGEPPEKTQSTLKVDWYPAGPVSLVRLQLAFPDEHQEGATVFSFFHPQMGDLKTRVGFRSFRVFGHSLASFVELTFPTASPPDIGQQKYQLMPGARLAIGRINARGTRFDVQVTQTVSVAGDVSAKDINKTNVELSLKRTWHEETYLSAKLKPVTDWEKSAYTGASAELRASVNLSARWSAWMMYGVGLWNRDATGLYESKIGFGFIREIGRIRIPIAAEE